MNRSNGKFIANNRVAKLRINKLITSAIGASLILITADCSARAQDSGAGVIAGNTPMWQVWKNLPKVFDCVGTPEGCSGPQTQKNVDAVQRDIKGLPSVMFPASPAPVPIPAAGNPTGATNFFLQWAQQFTSERDKASAENERRIREALPR